MKHQLRELKKLYEEPCSRCGHFYVSFRDMMDHESGHALADGMLQAMREKLARDKK